MKLPYRHPMTVAAHRGDSYCCYENTVEAFEAAIAAGADMIETDVRMTRTVTWCFIMTVLPSAPPVWT